MLIIKGVFAVLTALPLAASLNIDIDAAVNNYLRRGGLNNRDTSRVKNWSPLIKGMGQNKKNSPPPPRDIPGGIFDGIQSSPTLNFVPCYEYNDPSIPYQRTFQCARLEVPLDYNKPSLGIFKIAVIKIPADPTMPFRGSFIVNQDFENNVDFIQQIGWAYQLSGFLDTDVYAFDTRGTGHSTPQISCFGDQASFTAFAEEASKTDNIFGAFNGTFPPTDKNIRANIQASTGVAAKFGASCQKYYGDYLPYMSSADHARDLHNIVSQLAPNKQVNILNYGYSTVMGATYAAMFPNDFDTMVMDGTVDAAKVWSSSGNDLVAIQDANKAVEAFFDSCAAAPSCSASDLATTSPSLPVGSCNGCYFWAPTAAGVKARFEAVKAKYYQTPFKSSVPSPVCGDCQFSYDIISRGLGIDNPAGGLQFALLSSVKLLEWEMGRALPGGALEWFSINFPNTLTFYPPTIVQTCVDQATAVSGTGNIVDYMLSINASYNGLGIHSVGASEIWCAGWPVKARAKNPFPKNGFVPKKGGKINTKGKILFIANTMDGRHSLQNAKTVAGYFQNAGVLTVNQMGSTSFFSGYSLSCVNSYLADLSVGILPSATAFCNDVVGGPFGLPYQKDYR